MYVSFKVVRTLALLFIAQVHVSDGVPLKADNEFIDDYHYPMVVDSVRNELFYAALQNAIVPNKSRVLDVGAGSMLLSMMAADLGAAYVLGVEGHPSMAAIAKDVLKVNGYTSNAKKGNIQLFEGQFESLSSPHSQLRRPADVFVSETFDAALIGEKFLSILAHAKNPVNGLLTENAVIIPNSAVIYAQLLESTLSLPRDSNNSAYHAVGSGGLFEGYSKFRYNLEPMREYRRAGGYTVRYLNEENAVRQRLSTPTAMFSYDFQNYDISEGNFAYSCIVFDITETQEGVFDSIGLWFSLFLDKDRKLELSNAPAPVTHKAGIDLNGVSVESATTGRSQHQQKLDSNDQQQHEQHGRQHRQHIAPCWMQAVYRVSPRDVFVKKGDFLRLQVVQMDNTYIFSEVGLGRYNQLSRLVRFTAENCPTEVYVYAYENDKFTPPDGEEDFNPVDPGNVANEYLVGTIPVAASSTSTSTSRQTAELEDDDDDDHAGANSQKSDQISFAVFPARVNQVFKLVTYNQHTGRPIGMMYQLVDSTAQWQGSVREKARRKIPLDTYRFTCPSR